MLSELLRRKDGPSLLSFPLPTLGGLETSRRPCSQKRRFKGLVHVFTVEGGRESMTVSPEECICTHNFACNF